MQWSQQCVSRMIQVTEALLQFLLVSLCLEKLFEIDVSVDMFIYAHLTKEWVLLLIFFENGRLHICCLLHMMTRSFSKVGKAWQCLLEVHWTA